MLPAYFDALSARSRDLHGHKYVLPLAVWIHQSGQEVVTVREAMVGLSGRADRTRVIEALAKLAALEALTELPRAAQPNAPRYFQRRSNPYWALVEAYLVEVETQTPE